MKVCENTVFSQVSILATVTAAADLWSVLCNRTIRSAGSYEECYLSVACLRATQSAIPRTTSSTLTLDHIIRGCTIIPGWNIATIFCLNMWYYDIRSGYIFTDTSRDTRDYKQFINHHYHRISCEYAALNKQSVYFVARCLLRLQIHGLHSRHFGPSVKVFVSYGVWMDFILKIKWEWQKNKRIFIKTIYNTVAVCDKGT